MIGDGMKHVSLPQIADQTVNRAVQELGSAVNNVAKKFLEIYTITAAVKASVATSINHKLGRVPVGFFVVDCSGDIRVWRTAASTSTTISLQSSVDGTVTLILF